MPAPVFTMPIAQVGDERQVSQAAFEAAMNAAFVSLFNDADGARLSAEAALAGTVYRSITDFGVVLSERAVPASEAVATTNLGFLQDALDWSASEGAILFLPSGVVDIFGEAILPLGASAVGAGRMNTMLRQRMLPQTSGEAFTSVLSAPDVTVAGTGNGYNLLMNMTINGGWNLRDHAQAASGNWVYDPARMTQFGLELNTHSSGAGASTIRDAGSDAHALIQNVIFEDIAGHAIRSAGRGENFFSTCQARRCGISGMLLESPDCWINDMTSFTHGDRGIVITGSAGDMRMSNSKFWFTGMQISAEPNGAGIHLPDQGGSSYNFSNVTTQDTWGPGLDFAGTYGIRFTGAIDNAGGGRLRSQGFGYAGARTQPRSCIKTSSTLRGAHIDVQVKNGGQLDGGASQAPHLVYLAGSGIMGCQIQLRGDLANMHATLVQTIAGYVNADRYNEIWFGEKLLHGWVTEAELALGTHGVNDAQYGPSRAYLTDGRIATRPLGGGWILPPQLADVPVIATFATLAEAQAYSTANPTHWVYSQEGI